MRYLLAIILPPVAVLLCGKPIQALLNFILCIFFWIPGVIHAFAVVSSHKADKRNDKLIRAIQQQNRHPMH
ncbi:MULTISPECIES: YqaE/Pmp3 family membrane protein [Paenibacillus]|uniref:YqaE/Pmp3 family membrane protein n=1 Tax=Paenibacillus TaxID=44249 RepID=UPI00135812E3|nr:MULTISPECIES: YqaE/Pmp3 family membrane protein [Paenibacillus]